MTSVGIHERSAREKISHVMNGAAHVMNNEATRKYLQGLKRLLTFMQRAHPTDPSRSVEFDGYKDAGRGIIGGGSDKQARPLRRTVPLLIACFVDAALLWNATGRCTLFVAGGLASIACLVCSHGGTEVKWSLQRPFTYREFQLAEIETIPILFSA